MQGYPCNMYPARQETFVEVQGIHTKILGYNIAIVWWIHKQWHGHGGAYVFTQLAMQWACSHQHLHKRVSNALCFNITWLWCGQEEFCYSIIVLWGPHCWLKVPQVSCYYKCPFPLPGLPMRMGTAFEISNSQGICFVYNFMLWVWHTASVQWIYVD